MRLYHRWMLLMAGCFFTLALSGCGNPEGGDPASTAIDAYLQALTQKDENRMITLSCNAWESQARLEYDSFAAVKVTLEGPGCTKVGEDGETTLVSCSGKIIASYGNEDLEIELKKRTYQAVEEGGEWRMCGYR